MRTKYKLLRVLLNTVRERPRTSVTVREVILTARGQYCSSLAVYLPLLT